MAKVLFISNNENKIRFFSDIMAKNAVDTEIAPSEDVVFDKISECLPDLILLDTAFDVADIVMLAKKIKINTQMQIK